MSCVERFSLRWDRYQLHLVTAFQSLLSESDFVDVTLGVEGKKLSAHKMLLSACSPYFRDLLKGNPCQHPIILLRGIPFDDLSALLQFMYNGEVSVNQDQLDSFLKSAEALKIQGLTDNSEEKNSPSPNQNQSQPKKEDSPQHSKRKRRASNQQHPGNNEHKDYVAVPVAKQPRNIKPEVVDVTEDEPEDEPELFNETNKDIAITPISQQHEVYDASVDNYDDNDIGEETGVYADAVYNEDGFSQDQQGAENCSIYLPNTRSAQHSDKKADPFHSRKPFSNDYSLVKRRPYERYGQNSNKQYSEELARERHKKTVDKEVGKSDVVDLTNSENQQRLNTNTNTSCTPAEVDYAASKSKDDSFSPVVPRASCHPVQIDYSALRSDDDVLRENRKVVTDAHGKEDSSMPFDLSRVSKVTSAVNTSAARVGTSAARVDTSASRVDTSAARVDICATRADTSAARVETSAARTDTSAARTNTSATRLDTSASRVDISAARVDTRAYARADLEDANADDIPLFYECAICERRFVHHDSFIAHKKFHSGLTVCSICTHPFSTTGTLNRHLRTIHKIPMRRHK